MFNLLRDEKKRALLIQASGLFLVLAIFGYLFHNTQLNLEKQNIATGFGFFELEAGFDIGEALVEYWSDDTYLKALWVGVLNTLKVSILGNIFAVTLGVLIGLGHLSNNWLVKKLCRSYIEIVRNIPLLLQLFFWYALLTEALPAVKQAMEILPSVYLSNRGLNIPFPVNTANYGFSLFGFIVALIIFFFMERKRDLKQIETGVAKPLWEKLNYTIFLIPILIWALTGASTEFEIPKLVGFNFNGGYTLTPEFTALFVGLVIYTAAFNAEITRAGIQSISKGQWEAAHSLGLSQRDTVKIVILPQALRVMIPPLTSQVLNLTKNSSLAVAIGYPDFVSIANTTMNQTGQAVECVFMIMIVYLTFSLLTSIFMNWFNKKFALVER
ncbi:amino acid ABC transporter permease [Bacteriovorax sp. DB6_IX]|uniref:amino acid ABC transporter permease n=1 Tax=Bacteriovorax sp. DB6_IX TaxID=1353530 RepID=UPI00038A25B3|nr:ABC transporter permease subunit [Bacteriovorax sp. DB6_IX]EQC51044.1 putative general L-amino acid transport system permease protein AapQ [Bacteriovorax sp. DB6_IX]